MAQVIDNLLRRRIYDSRLLSSLKLAITGASIYAPKRDRKATYLMSAIGSQKTIIKSN